MVGSRGRERGLAVIVALASVPASAQPSHTKSSVRLNSVVIERNGALAHQVSGDETTATCSRFRLTTADAREFFAKAVPVDAERYGHDLDASNCVVTGKATMVGGASGHWTIDLERRGELVLSDGKRHYYYCAKCSARQYDEVDARTVP